MKHISYWYQILNNLMIIFEQAHIKRALLRKRSLYNNIYKQINHNSLNHDLLFWWGGGGNRLMCCGHSTCKLQGSGGGGGLLEYMYTSFFLLTVRRIRMFFSLKHSAFQGESSLKISARWSSPFRRSQGKNKHTNSLTDGALIERLSKFRVFTLGVK